MHLARRAYVLVMLAAVLAIIGVWYGGDLAGLWRIPAVLLLIGLAAEGALVRRSQPSVRIELAERSFLGRPQPAVFVFGNPGARELALEYAPATPAGFEVLTQVRRVSAPPHAEVSDPVLLLPVRLGPQSWPLLPARRLGAFSLAWWSLALRPKREVLVAPDAWRGQVRPRGMAGGARPRRVVGAGAELHQLREYVRGDSFTRIDWKATARSGGLITREYSEDQHLDILVAVDAGRLSRVRSGVLDRFGVYSNVAARFAEIVTQRDDRIGLLVYADRVLASCPPARGLAAVTRVRGALERLSVQGAESDPTVAAISIRSLLKHRSLVVLLTDLDDANVADQLTRAVRLLAPPHLVLVAGVLSGEIGALAQQTARDWQDPWIAIAAAEHEGRAAQQRALLQRLGAPVVAVPAERLEQALIARYEALRRRRRI